MSALAGVRVFGPTQHELGSVLSSMDRHLERRGPDGSCRVIRGPVAMLYRPFHTTTESRRERQPHRTPAGALVTWDGRLDNRDELGRELGLATADRPTDVELVGWAYDRWGARFPRHLVGDFAVSVWDAGQDRLLLARDPFGTRPLFYAVEAGRQDRLLWASNLTAVVTAGDLDTTVDEEWIGGYLVGVPPAGHTPYRGIREVPAGSTVTFEGCRRSQERYWPPGDLELQRLDERAYEERFLELLAEGVRARMRAEGTVFAELSGGVDSSSIVCLAEEVLRCGVAAADELAMISFVFDRAASSDEREYIRAVEARIGRPAHHLNERDYPLFADLDSFETEVPSALAGFLGRYRGVQERMKQSGSRVVLNGVGGDEVGWSLPEAPAGLADHLWAGRLGRWVQELGRWQPNLEEPLWRAVWKGSFLPLLPRLGVSSMVGWERPHWLAESFIHRSRIKEWPRRLTDASHARLPAPSQRVHAYLVQSMAVRQVQLRHPLAELCGREERFPFLHRPLVEFCLSIPFDQLCRPGDGRSLHRRALRGVLPEAVRLRRDKRGPDEALVRALGQRWPEVEALFGPEARVFRRHIVDPDSFRASLEQSRFGVEAELNSVRRVLEVELWLRGLEAEGRLRASA